MGGLSDETFGGLPVTVELERKTSLYLAAWFGGRS